mgnify:CR=1 FL=1
MSDFDDDGPDDSYDDFDPREGGTALLDSPFAFQGAVSGLLDVGQRDRAKQMAMDFIARDPSNPSGHMALARILHSTEQLPAALRAVETALTFVPDSDAAHILRAEILEDIGRFADAEESYRRGLELDPADAGAHGAYAQLLWKCDRNIEALQRTEHALSLDPDLYWLHNLRARLLLEVHPRHWTISEDAVRTSLRMNPFSADAHATLGLVLLRGRRGAEAEEAFREALRLDPSNKLALTGLSELVKGKAPWYVPMLWYGQMMSRLGADGQLGVLVALWALYSASKALLPPGNQSAADLMTAVYLGFCAYTWFAEPITRAVLKRSYPWLA